MNPSGCVYVFKQSSRRGTCKSPFLVPYSSCLNPLSPLRLYLKKRYTMSEVKACRSSNSALLSGCCKVCSLKLFWTDGWREALNICYIGSFKSCDWHYTSKYTCTAKTWAQSQPHCKLEKVQMPVDELQDHLKATNSRKRPSWGHALDIYQAWHIWSLAIQAWHKDDTRMTQAISRKSLSS